MKRRETVHLAALGLLLAATLPLASPAQAAATTPTCRPATGSVGVGTAVTKARAALKGALSDLDTGHLDRARRELRAVRRSTQAAHAAATALIGKPPSDPESDDPPGVAAVLKVGALEHSVAMALVPMFGDPQGHAVHRPLGKGLVQAVACRDAMLGRVIALKAGARDDYVDGLSDTLPTFDQELAAIALQLAGDDLTDGGRTRLTSAQTVVTRTRAAMRGTFGGGERLPSDPSR